MTTSTNSSSVPVAPAVSYRTMRRLTAAIAFVLFLTAFYLEENWRGKRAWEKQHHQYQAAGHVVDWEKFIPPAIPDEQNVFKFPKMTEWFVKGADRSDDSKNFSPPSKGVSELMSPDLIVATNGATEYLEWSDQSMPQFDQIREALKRPDARMEGNFSDPVSVPVPNFVKIRNLAQNLSLRVRCHLLLNHPDRALSDLLLMHQLSRLLEPPASGRPETLVAAMVNVAIGGVYADTVADGFRIHGWQERQLVEIERQLDGKTLRKSVHAGLECEAASHVKICQELTNVGYKEFHRIFRSADSPSWKELADPMFWLVNIAPHGWLYQNMTSATRLYGIMFESLEPRSAVMHPERIRRTMDTVGKELESRSPFNMVGWYTIPNFSKAIQTAARNESKLHQALIACELERYKLVHGKYPGSLDELDPNFLKKMSADIIGGKPLHYRRTDDGKFLLYSIGWNEKDDGGIPSGTSAGTDGDWVWQN